MPAICCAAAAKPDTLLCVAARLAGGAVCQTNMYRMTRRPRRQAVLLRVEAALQNFNGTRPELEFSVPLLSRTTSLGLYAQ